MPVASLPRAGAALLLAAVSLGWSPSARADEPAPLARYHPDAIPPTSAKTTLFVLGTSMFAVSYGASLGASYLWETDPGAADLRYPVVGPWMKVGQTQLCPDDAEECSDFLQVFGAVAAGFDGLLQAGSLLVLTQAIFLKTGQPQLSSPAISGNMSAGLPRAPETFRLRAAPVHAGSTLGMTVFGTF
jgi:hypothetical protein